MAQLITQNLTSGDRRQATWNGGKLRPLLAKRQWASAAGAHPGSSTKSPSQHLGRAHKSC
jgi:hypothetical protein